jgi:hypothetical protein
MPATSHRLSIWREHLLAPSIFPRLRLARSAAIFCGALAVVTAGADPVKDRFRKEVQPILAEYCLDCHGDGMDKGGVAFDAPDDVLFGNHDLWWAALKNLRAGTMPPEKKPRPSAKEIEILEQWIKTGMFGIDPANPDPGRVTIRRLNRTEYRNTIRDLMGVDFKTEEEFPPDDTGYGFDNIGDVLTVSPLLLEKYMQAAEVIVEKAVPTVAKVVAETLIPAADFLRTDGKQPGDRFSFYEPATLSHQFKIEQPGTYRVLLELNVLGQFAFDPGRCEVVLTVDGEERKREEFGWENNKRFTLDVQSEWQPAVREFQIEIRPLVPVEQKRNSLDLRLAGLKVQGPTEERFWRNPPNYDRFFFEDEPPANAVERRVYAREVLRRFAGKAFRRPVDDRTVERLAVIAEEIYSEPGKRFEHGIARALIAVLASPRFLFRVETPENPSDRFALVDEHALASRLSYFFWSTMPDAELLDLAGRGELRKNLDAQVKRLLGDSRSEALVQNFVGQWLQVRDIETVPIDARAVLAREQTSEPRQTGRGRFGRPRVELDGPLRRDMRQETERYFSHVVRENRSVLELIDSDYTFLNERLAKHYGLTNVNVTGNDLRQISLPAGHARGGILTHGSVLAVTSNPTRTSPVKRGLFILDNILGSPPPPPPVDVPELEEAEKEFKDREPSLREVLELHRNKPLCSSCHNRMDPLGLALENFNAMGMWREKERNLPIEAAGKLITGETFANVRELKKALATERKSDFYRCLTEKLLTYALGRGLEYYDVETVDQIVDRLDREEGRFSALLSGIVESAPFQKVRTVPAVTPTASSTSSKPVTQASATP